MSADDLAHEAFGDTRITTPRRRIARAVGAMRGAFTADELVSALNREGAPSASTATVYRALASMHERGFIERVGVRDGVALFAHCEAAGHHHHIVCDRCGHTEHTSCPIGPALADAATGSGFTVTRHEVTLYGLCRTCSAKGRC